MVSTTPPNYDTLLGLVRAKGFTVPQVPSMNYLLSLVQPDQTKVAIKRDVKPDFDSRLLASPFLNTEMFHKKMVQSPLLRPYVQEELTKGSTRFACEVLDLISNGAF